MLIRPKEIRDRKTKEVVETLSPAERGEALLTPALARQPGDGNPSSASWRATSSSRTWGISDEDLAELSRTDPT